MTTQLSLLDRDWVSQNIPVLIQSLAGREFTTDDAHRVFSEPENRNLVGVMFAKLRCQGRIKRIGYRASARPEANGRVVAVWRVV